MTSIAAEIPVDLAATRARLGPWLGWGAFAVATSFVVLQPLVGATILFALYVGFNALFNLPHQYCTWVRAVREPVDPAPNHLVRVAIVALAGLAVIALVHADLVGPTKEALLTNALPYWGIWHLAAQHFGISAVLRKRGGEHAALARDRAFFVALFTLGVVHFHASQELEFHVLGHVSRMWRLPFPETARSAIAAATTVAYLAACAVHLAPAWRTNRLRAEYQSLVAAATFGAFFLCDDIMMTTASITSLHNVHYMGFVADYQQGRAFSDPAARALGWRDVGFGLAYSAIVNAVFLIALPAGEVLLATLVSLHYLVDGRLWRFRKDPSLGRYLGLTAR